MSIVRVGTTKKYSENWGAIFGGQKSAKSAPKKTEKSPSATKAQASPKKKAAPKKSKKK